MDVMIVCCAGLDVHKDSIEACVRRIEKDGKLQQQNRRWGTMTRELESMAEWLSREAVTHIAMESTGVYWKPIFNILEKRFQVLLVNARSIKHVPGRKTDQKDSQWIADLHQHGLLRKSFVPPKQIRDLRDLTRTRATLAQDHSSICNRIQKVLEDANIKLASVASDVFGASGRAILQALMKGESDAEGLAELPKADCGIRFPNCGGHWKGA